MVHDRVHVPVGVAVAALVLGVMAFIGLLLAACSAYALFVENSPLIPRIPSVRLATGILDLLIFALVLLAACTIVGLLRLKIWARYSVILLGLLEFLAFAVMAALVLIGRAKSGMAALPIPGHVATTLGDLLLALAASCAALALIGVWWMAYFSRARVRLLFAEAEARLTL